MLQHILNTANALAAALLPHRVGLLSVQVMMMLHKALQQ